MLLLSTLLALPASGFAPSDQVVQGTPPSRLRTDFPQVQAELQRSPAWQRFVASDGVGWRVKFDEATRSARYLWGQGIPMPADRDAMTAALQGLYERHADLLGLDHAELALKSANYNQTYDTWYVDFDALRDGTPTYRGGISARIKHGKLVLMVVGTAPNSEVTGSWSIPEADALQLAIANGPAPGARHTEPLVTAQLLERQGQHGVELRRTYLVHSRTVDPPGKWVTFVDAENGQLLSVHNDVSFINGNVEIQHHVRTLDGTPLVSDPAEEVIVDGDFDSDTTDVNGDYTVTTSSSYFTDLDGNYCQINDASGSDGTLTSSNANLTWTTSSSSATQAELDSYIFLHQVRAWAVDVDPTVPWTYYTFTSNVNENSSCNAYFDGYSVHFYEAGSGCNNTGEIADVEYHEWGHGFHAYSILSGGFDPSLSEGAADVVSAFNTGDSEIGPYFFTGGGAIRDIGPDQVYPQDYDTYCYGGYCDPHANGLIFGGAIWDLWNILVADLGDPAGTDAAESIFAGLLKGGSDIVGSYYEATVADDDDGNLGNGTPHICQINEAFGRHGLGAGTVGGAEILVPNGDPLTFVPANLDAEVSMELQSTAPECFTASLDEATVHYRVDGGADKSVVATITGESFTAAIPGQPLNSFVEYWVTGTDGDGNAFTAPFSGERAPYTYFVGDVIQIGCEDFEATDGGYQHELVSGTVSDGADDWMWGTPAGLANDPSGAYSGNNAWGNDLGLTISGQPYNGLYQSDKYNRLFSSKLDSLWYTDVFLQYRRWLNVEDGFYDQADITVNGDQVWGNWTGSAVGGANHEDREWISHVVDLKRKADQDKKIELAWELHSDGGLELAGWNIDDVCLYAPMTPDNRLAIVDFVVEDQGGPIGVSWTNPIYDPVDRVVVVRNVDHYPTDWQDGDLLIDINAPVPGEFTEAVHGNQDGASGYYAAYAFDGSDWLSWTIEGWNAGHADPNEGGDTATGTIGPDGTVNTTTATSPDEVPGADTGIKGSGGCACGTTSSPSLAWPVFGLLLLVRRRRV